MLSALVFVSQIATAETVQVKYHGAVSLETFACTDVAESSDVSRICFDEVERYMVIKLKATYYHYCEIDAARPSKSQLKAAVLRSTNPWQRYGRTIRLPDAPRPKEVHQVNRREHRVKPDVWVKHPLLGTKIDQPQPKHA